MNPEQWYKWKHKFGPYQKDYYRYVRHDTLFAIRNRKIFTPKNCFPNNKIGPDTSWKFYSDNGELLSDWELVELPKLYLEKLKIAKMESL